VDKATLLQKLEAMFDDIARTRTWANVEVEFRDGIPSMVRVTDVTGLFCTSRREREFTRRTAGYAKQEVQSGADRNVAAPD